ncbi:MAG: ZIP family metal transporter [Alphaproteobacteria bacterium]
MDTLSLALVYATLAGATIPLGGLTARVEPFRRRWIEREFRHGVIAFGGGVLLAAVALVLVPEGTRHLPASAAAAALGLGGVAAMLADRAIERRGGAAAQLMAMLLDYVPEALALGATLAGDPGLGLLLALLIALQNYPEAFNAYCELHTGAGVPANRALADLAAVFALGPLAAALGVAFLADAPAVLGAVMLAAAGGILYLTFQDIAPQAKLERDWAPPLGAVLGFLVGMLGHELLG